MLKKPPGPRLTGTLHLSGLEPNRTQKKRDKTEILGGTRREIIFSKKLIGFPLPLKIKGHLFERSLYFLADYKETSKDSLRMLEKVKGLPLKMKDCE